MIKFLNLKASTLCASGALLVLGGFMTVNLAGCGGGGGSALVSPTASPVGATFLITQQDGSVSPGGTLTLTRGSSTQTATANAGGVVTIPNLSPGTYTATYTAFDGSGNPLPSTTRSVTVTPTGSQSYTLVQGDTGNGAFTVTGLLLLNPTGSNDPDDNVATGNCTAQSVPITASVLISVRDLNSTNGTPIIAQVVRSAQASSTSSSLLGRYTISLPYRPQSFRIEVGSTATTGTTGASTTGTNFAGISATTTFTPNTTALTGVNVCTNINGVIPSPQITPTAVPTTTPFMFVTPTTTPNVVGAGTPIGTTAASATATAIATATATATVSADATATAAATASAGATATAAATAGAGATATAAATSSVSATATAAAVMIVPTTASASPTPFGGSTQGGQGTQAQGTPTVSTTTARSKRR